MSDFGGGYSGTTWNPASAEWRMGDATRRLIQQTDAAAATPAHGEADADGKAMLLGLVILGLLIKYTLDAVGAVSTAQPLLMPAWGWTMAMLSLVFALSFMPGFLLLNLLTALAFVSSRDAEPVLVNGIVLPIALGFLMLAPDLRLALLPGARLGDEPVSLWGRFLAWLHLLLFVALLALVCFWIDRVIIGEPFLVDRDKLLTGLAAGALAGLVFALEPPFVRRLATLFVHFLSASDDEAVRAGRRFGILLGALLFVLIDNGAWVSAQTDWSWLGDHDSLARREEGHFRASLSPVWYLGYLPVALATVFSAPTTLLRLGRAFDLLSLLAFAALAAFFFAIDPA